MCTGPVSFLCFSRNTRRFANKMFTPREKNRKGNYDTVNKLVLIVQIDGKDKMTNEVDCCEMSVNPIN